MTMDIPLILLHHTEVQLLMMNRIVMTMMENKITVITMQLRVELNEKDAP